MQVQVPYQEAIGRKYPEQVAIALARDARGKCNPITVGWTMLTSHQPPMMAISIGRTRYSLEVIRHARQFVISFPSAGMGEDALYFGTVSGRDVDKLEARGTRAQPASQIDGVLLAEAVANFECVLESELETGDHVLFVGRVVAAHVNKSGHDASRQPLQLFEVRCGRHILNSGYLFRISFDPSLIDDESQEFPGWDPERALFWIQAHTMLTEHRKSLL